MRADRKLRASEYLVDIPWRPATFTGMADVARVAEAFEGGATLVVQGLHHWWPALSAFCRSLEATLGHAAQANAYYTPRSAQGLPVHHDTHDVFCLQIAGEKRWLVYDPVWELPLKDQRYNRAMGEAGATVLDVTLRPGDTLYLPRGWLHEAKTSDADSLHLTVGVNVYTWLDAFRAAIDELAQDVGFRRSPEGDAEPLVERLATKLGADDVRRRMREKLVRTRRPVLDGQLAQLRTLDQLDGATLLERRPTVLADLTVGDGKAVLVFEGREVEFPERLHGELEFITVADEPFCAEDLPGKLDAEGRLVLVSRLVREGFLRIRPG